MGDGNYNDGYQDMLANFLLCSTTLVFCNEVAQNRKIWTTLTRGKRHPLRTKA